MTGRPRLVIALVVASLLAVFLVYQGFVSAGTLLVSVSQLRSDRDGAAHKKVNLTGVVLTTSGTDSPMKFVLKDDASAATVAVSYTGSVPDAFKATRHVIVTGRMRGGVFVAEPDSLLTKCPSKYSSGGSGT
jgi:cytochrome c-type biogenesis protein CcmE